MRVEVTADLSFCKVYVSAIKGLLAAQKAADALKSAAGLVRYQVSRRLNLRHTPQILFFATDSIEYSAKIEKMLKSK